MNITEIINKRCYMLHDKKKFINLCESDGKLYGVDMFKLGMRVSETILHDAIDLYNKVYG